MEHLYIMSEHFREYNLKLKPSKCSFFQSEIVHLALHISCEGIHPSRENVCAIVEFPMLETLTKVRVFCCLVGHNQPFIKGFAHITRPLYDVLGKEVKMGPVQLPPEVQKALMLCLQTLISCSYWRWMLLSRGWVLYCPINRMTCRMSLQPPTYTPHGLFLLVQLSMISALLIVSQMGWCIGLLWVHLRVP